MENKTKKKKPISYWILDLSTALIIVGSALIGYLYFIDGSTPISVNRIPALTVEPHKDSQGNYVEKHIFYTGEQLTYLFEYCKNRNTPVEMYGYYIDTVKVAMPVVKLKSPVGCDAVISDHYKIPRILPSGKYYFEVELVYQVNPLRKVSVIYRTEEFQIINNN